MSSLPKSSEPSLSPAHRDLLEKVSAISPEVITERGYRTEPSSAGLTRLGFGRFQGRPPFLVIPLRGLDGSVVGYQARPDSPRVRDGKPIKYELPKGTRVPIDVPPRARALLTDPGTRLLITEGIRKADSAVSRGLCCVALLGVWGGEHRDLWDRVPLTGREVCIAFDSDLASNRHVQGAALRLRQVLEPRGARVRFILLPALADGRKQGIDDFFSAGGTADELLGMVTDDPEFPGAADGQPDRELGYRTTTEGLFRAVEHRGEVRLVRLTDFPARITAEVVVTDGAEERRELEIEATIDGTPVTAMVAAEEFAPMGWIVPRLGPMAILAAGTDTKDHARAAIQAVSGRIPTVRAFTHLGWVRIGGSDVFLFADGGIGADFAAHWDPGASGRPTPKISRFPVIGDPGPGGPPRTPDEAIHTIRVRAPEPLRPFRLPVPPAGDELRQAIRDSLELVTVAPDTITLPLYAALWRALLGGANFSVALDGGTGNGKTSLVVLFQQHLGPGMDADNLPAGWGSTANYLEAVCFLAKDLFLVIDDWVARGSQADVDRANREADRFFRGQGNRSGRGRCATDGTPRPARHSRCLPVCTQEEAPVGHSLNARVLRLDVGKADVLAPANLPLLNRLQKLAAAGQFAKVTAGYVAYLAADLPGCQALFREQRDELRENYRADGRHPRTATIAAELAAAFNVFLEFAAETGAIDEDAYADYFDRLQIALHEKADDQHRHLAAQDPVTQFLHCMHAALVGGHCHVANREGGAPHDRPGAWGWREEMVYVAKSPLPVTLQDSPSKPAPTPDADDDGGVEERSRWRACGTRVGWVFNGKLYLLPEKALGEAQKVARDMGHRLTIQYQSLGRMLSDAGLLAERDRSRGRFTKRFNAEGGRHSTLCLDAEKVMRREFHLAEFAEDDYDGPDPSREILGDGGSTDLVA